MQGCTYWPAYHAAFVQTYYGYGHFTFCYRCSNLTSLCHVPYVWWECGHSVVEHVHWLYSRTKDYFCFIILCLHPPIFYIPRSSSGIPTDVWPHLGWRAISATKGQCRPDTSQPDVSTRASPFGAAIWAARDSAYLVWPFWRLTLLFLRREDD